MKSINLYCFSS